MEAHPRLDHAPMIRFQLFGIPVEIQPFFWITTALLGGAYNARTPDSILSVALFLLAALVSILVHELGHALVGLKYGGGRARILLTAFGGLAINDGARFNKEGRFRMIAAGPGAGFALFIAVVAGLCLFFNDADVLAYLSRVLVNQPTAYRTMDLVLFMQENPVIHMLVQHLLWINFWWGIINLLPVMPLDGGQITDLYVSPQKRVYLIGAIAAGAMAVFGYLWLDSMYTAVLFGFLAWQNYQNMQSVRWQ
jgi:stage IV sporulation protein FB